MRWGTTIFRFIEVKWWIVFSSLLALVGYFGPWVNHRVAGLVIVGLDLGEYVKFLVPVRSGQIAVWREGFYLPLVAVSFALSLTAYRDRLAYWWPVRSAMLLVAAVAALNMLPPAWSPSLLMTAEFRLQTMAIGACLAVMLISPFMALLSRWIPAAIVAVLSLVAIWFPMRDFWRVLPSIRALYRQPIELGWGIYVMVLGLIILSGAVLYAAWRHEQPAA